MGGEGWGGKGVWCRGAQGQRGRAPSGGSGGGRGGAPGEGRRTDDQDHHGPPRPRRRNRGPPSAPPRRLHRPRTLFCLRPETMDVDVGGGLVGVLLAVLAE